MISFTTTSYSIATLLYLSSTNSSAFTPSSSTSIHHNFHTLNKNNVDNARMNTNSITTSNHNHNNAIHNHLEMVKKVFIDGEAGTTGIQVRERLSERDDLEIISPPSDLRKDEDTRKKFINEADAVILCTY
jgi:hypothetical protein